MTTRAMPAVYAWPVETAAHVETLRQLRNAGRDGFAHDNGEISEAQQAAWWAANGGRVLAWLFTRGGYYDPREVVGYGLLRRGPDGRLWSSVAVAPAFRGLGYGLAVTRATVERAPAEVWGEARRDNPAALRLHDPEYWELVEEGERTCLFRTRTKRRG